jgi:FKBP-type peptidyl-prolyl cis-trans isomerase SlyD
MKVEKNKVVGIHYTISMENNEVIYSTLGFEQEVYVHGSISIFPAVAKALEGHVAGDELDVVLAPSKAYGLKNEKLIYQIDNNLFSDIEKFEIGEVIQIPGGQEARLLQKKGKHLLVDANHPLAGEQLHYKITIVSIRDASDMEIKWGRTEKEIKTCSGEPGCC